MSVEAGRALEQLVDDLRRERISRREFVARSLGIGLGLGSVGGLLAACGGRERGKPAETRSTADLGPIERELHLYNWSDYIAQDTVANFEREFGVRVTYDTYESNEEMIAKLQAGATGYDIIVPTGYVVPVLVATRLIVPLHRKYLTNWDNVSPIFQNLPTDPGHPAYRAVAVGHVGDRLSARQGDLGGGQLGGVLRPAPRRQDDHDGRRPRSDRRDAPLSGALAQLGKARRARPGPSRTPSPPSRSSRRISRRR